MNQKDTENRMKHSRSKKTSKGIAKDSNARQGILDSRTHSSINRGTSTIKTKKTIQALLIYLPVALQHSLTYLHHQLNHQFSHHISVEPHLLF